VIVTTPRLVVRPFTDMDRALFHALNTHRAVVESLGQSPWGHGYASEAAPASLRHGFDQVGLDEIVAFTTTLNTRSQAVMVRIGMRRDADGDFDHPALPEDGPPRHHALYRIGASQLPPTVAA
jgi:RimJ/RimL family protein N-acetyltransferase